MADPIADSGSGAGSGALVQRILAVLVLLLGGILSLPVAAYFLDDQGTENYIIPVALVGIAVLGFVVGWILPGLAGATASRRRGAVAGAIVGIVMSLVGTAIFFVLINGFGGA